MTITQKESPDSAATEPGQIDQNPTAKKGTIMKNTTTVTLDFDQDAVKEWIDKVRANHTILGDEWFEQRAFIPPAPIPTPAWAESTKYSGRMYPEITIEFRGEEHAIGTQTAQLTQWVTIFVEDLDDGEKFESGDKFEAGTVVWGDVDVLPGQGDAISLEDALHLSLALGQAVEGMEF